ncbi:RNA pyrophosphohydrolase [Magnetovibrio sp.]|uniref:RNA pyrophosphohydrolase n=1 Tax=Magnetovibrio sp. TaxID=2024836 RepID=UPI002F9552BE
MTKKRDLPYRLGVGAVLLNADGLVFVAKRIDTPGDAWQLPQGGIDADEDPREAVMRELDEEIGTNKAEIISETEDWLTYDLPKEVRKQVWKGRYRGQKQKWYAMRFLGDDSDIDLNTHKHPEFSEWRWVDMKHLPDLIVPFKRDLYLDIVDAFVDLTPESAEKDQQA